MSSEQAPMLDVFLSGYAIPVYDPRPDTQLFMFGASRRRVAAGSVTMHTLMGWPAAKWDDVRAQGEIK